MLSPHDAEVVRRDPALPGLATLFDPGAFLAALRARLPGVDLRGAANHYVRYKPGTSCLAAYRIESAGGEALGVYAKAYRPDDRAKVGKRLDAPGVASALGPGPFLLDDVAVLVCPFPNDAEVDALPALGDRQARADLLRRVLPDRPDLWEGELRPLAYKPERRYVARLDVGGEPRAAIKAYSPDGFTRVSRSAKLLRSRGTLRLPRRLGRSERHRVLALEWIPGRPLNEVLAAPTSDPRPLESVGRALAVLHADAEGKLEVVDRGAVSAGLLAVADGLASMVSFTPAAEAVAIARELIDRLEDRRPRVVSTHGDLHPQQVILSGEVVGLLDTDEAARGDAAGDLGNLLARVESDALAGRVPAGRAEHARASLERGYASAGPTWDEPGVGLYTAVGLLRLAHQPFRSRDPEWPARTAALLAAARAHLDRIG